MRRPFGEARLARGQETATRLAAGRPAKPEHAPSACGGPGRRRCLVRTWRGLGRDSGAGRWLSRDFPATAAQDFFSFFRRRRRRPGGVRRGRERKRLQFEPMQPCGCPGGAPLLDEPPPCFPDCPRRDRGAEPVRTVSGRASRPSCRCPASPPALCAKLLRSWLRGSQPPALPRAPCRGARPGWRGR